ncbi:MAG TPA: TrbI/VirB10 family protein [Opitutaceae bacterium]|nr:TrbI/VirB10 family protein [Opitutaceae bacterium]
MKAFFQTRTGIVSVLLFVCLMGLVLHRVADNRAARRRRPPATKAVATARSPVPMAGMPGKAPPPTPPTTPPPLPDPRTEQVAENAAYLDQVFALNHHTRSGHDRQGNPVTKRATAATPPDAGRTTEEPPAPPDEPPPDSRPALRASPRLQGHPRSAAHVAASAGDSETVSRDDLDAGVSPFDGAGPNHDERPDRPRPKRFNPYGGVLKCELVFTLDSTSEQTPLVGLVMEPVYNNGLLVIPSGTELHGTARPDRLRDRIFSGTDWVLVFPREDNRPNGRQLTVRGVALDRIEPQATGMTWGITDGSYGLQGQVIRSLQAEEVTRFAATFLAAAAETLEQRQSSRGQADVVRNTPQNALLQGLAANLQQIAQDVSAEIEKHGVFIRVPAGHQFYFYPMQIIDPDAADISSNIATVK